MLSGPERPARKLGFNTRLSSANELILRTESTNSMKTRKFMVWNEIGSWNMDHWAAPSAGIMVYYPVFGTLPSFMAGISMDSYISNCVDFKKDVEGMCFTYNQALYRNKRIHKNSKGQDVKSILPCTPLAVIKILEYLKVIVKTQEYHGINNRFRPTTARINSEERESWLLIEAKSSATRSLPCLPMTTPKFILRISIHSSSLRKTTKVFRSRNGESCFKHI